MNLKVHKSNAVAKTVALPFTLLATCTLKFVFLVHLNGDFCVCLHKYKPSKDDFWGWRDGVAVKCWAHNQKCKGWFLNLQPQHYCVAVIAHLPVFSLLLVPLLSLTKFIKFLYVLTLPKSRCEATIRKVKKEEGKAILKSRCCCLFRDLKHGDIKVLYWSQK